MDRDREEAQVRVQDVLKKAIEQEMSEMKGVTTDSPYSTSSEARILNHVAGRMQQAMDAQHDARQADNLTALLNVLPRQMPHAAEMGLRYLLQRAGL